jgi:hypothetical protein
MWKTVGVSLHNCMSQTHTHTHTHILFLWRTLTNTSGVETQQAVRERNTNEYLLETCTVVGRTTIPQRCLCSNHEAYEYMTYMK